MLKLLMACQVRQMATWPAVLVSGLASVILAFVILALSSWMFKESIKLLGIFVGADLILTSVALLLIAFMARLGMLFFQDPQKLEMCFLRFIFLLARICYFFWRSRIPETGYLDFSPGNLLGNGQNVCAGHKAKETHQPLLAQSGLA